MSKIVASLSDVLVFAADGSVKWEDSFAAIQNAVEAELEENRSFDSTVCGALDQFFDTVPANVGVAAPFVIQAVSAQLSGGNFLVAAEYAKKVSEYLDRSTRFVSKRGRNGGLFRIG